MGKPPSINIFISEVVQLDLSLLTRARLLVSADERKKQVGKKVTQREDRHGDPASIDLYKYPSLPATPPTSRKNVSRVKMTNVKMSNALCVFA